MKAHILQLLAGIAFMAIPVVAQQWQYVAQDYHACATNGTVVVVVGNNGHILRSTDTARTWTLPNSRTYNHLLTAKFVDEQTVLCGGSSGLLLRSTDAGATWNTLPFTSQSDITTLVAIQPSTLYAITTVEIYRSTDKGSTWVPLPSLPDTVRHAAFSTIADGVIVTATGKMYHTADSSRTWTEVFSDTSKGIAGVFWTRVSYNACGKGGGLYASLDGKNWNAVTAYLSGIDGKRIATKSDKVAVVGSAINFQGKNAIAYSNNGTFTWNFPNESLRPYPLDDFRDVVFLNNHTVVICGDNSKLIIGDSTGTKWRLAAQAYMDPEGWGKTVLNCGGTFLTKDTGIVVGNVFTRGGWLRTTDRGITWDHDNGAFMDLLIKPTFFPYSKKLITVSFSYGNIFESFDFGKSWQGRLAERVPNEIGTLDIAWLNEQKALLVYDSLVFNTTDGGTSWQGFPLPLYKRGYLNHITFASEKVGYITGVETEDPIEGPSTTVIFKTTNGGGTWRRVFERRPSRQIWGIAARDEQTVVFGYPKLWDDRRDSPDTSFIFRSTNGGASWDSTVVVGGNVTEVKFYSPDHAVATGINGMLYQSADGGGSWSAQRVPDIELPKHPHWLGSVLSRDGKTLFLTGEGIMIRGELPQQISDVPTATVAQSSSATLSTYFDQPSETLQCTLQGAFPDDELTTIMVSDVLGRVLHQEQHILRVHGDKRTATVASSSLPSGQYVVQIIGKNYTASGTAIVVR